jgi:hypothetical protein
MTLTKEDKDVLKILVEKELSHVEKDGDELLISNADYLTKVGNPDLPFLKAITLYEEFLKDLKKKL